MDELEELLKLAETGEQVKLEDPSYDEEQVRSFIRINNVVEGSNPIPAIRIFEKYKDWAGPEALPYIVFFREFDKLFKYKRSLSHKYYRLSPGPLGLHPQYTIWKDRMLQRNTANGKGKKKTQIED